ncbi:MAG: LacI family DNA-binding transcriptional regulator [Armatimonadota bacterium]
MATKIRDIARHLNLSVSTVSYALNNGPRPVAPEVRQRVLDAAKEMDYRPNRIAKSLSAKRSGIVGFVPARPNDFALLIPYTQNILNGIMIGCEELHYDFMVFAQHGRMPHSEFVDLLTDGRVDGLIFSGDPLLDPVREACVRRRTPFVTLSGTATDDPFMLRVDNAMGIRQMVEHMVDLGHTKIGAMVGDDYIPDIVTRCDVLLSELRSRGLMPPEEWIGRSGLSPVKAQKSATEILSRKDRPTALVCLTDEIAIGAMRAAYHLRLHVPDDLSVIGFDDFVHAEATNPPLTTIRQPAGRMGRDAVAMLLDHINSRPVEPSKPYATQLIVRDSTSAPKKELNP